MPHVSFHDAYPRRKKNPSNQWSVLTAHHANNKVFTCGDKRNVTTGLPLLFYPCHSWIHGITLEGGVEVCEQKRGLYSLMSHSLHSALYNWNRHVPMVFSSEEEMEGIYNTNRKSKYIPWYSNWVDMRKSLWREGLNIGAFKRPVKKNCETSACWCCSSKMNVKDLWLPKWISPVIFLRIIRKLQWMFLFQ